MIDAGNRLAIVASLCFSVIAFFDHSNLLPDLASHFRFLYLLIGLLGILISLIFKTKYFLIASLVLLAINAPAIFPYTQLASKTTLPETQSKKLRILLSNIKTENTKYQDFLTLVKNAQPDVAVILEVNSEWTKQLQTLSASMPYSQFYPRPDNFGIAVMSKYELSVPNRTLYKEHGIRKIDVNLSVEGEAIRLLGLHALPPSNHYQLQRRNKLILEAANLVSNETIPVIIAGDLNTTMWNQSYRDLLRIAKLLDPRKGRGIFPTWPATYGIPLIPIDHILYSDHFQVSDFRTLKIEGSDHRALVLELILDS